MADAALDAEILAIGRDLAAAFPRTTRNPLKAMDDKAMDFASHDAELKAALFRFVDVVPACRSLDDLARHLTGFLEEVDDRPPSIEVAMRMGNTRAGRTALGAAAASGVRRMAHRFIVGDDAADALPTLKALWKNDVAATVDLLGEATVTEAEADRYAARCAQALDQLAAAYAPFPEKPELERDSIGPLPRANLSVKVSALTPLLRPDAPERGKRDAAPRLRELLRRAKRLDAHLHIDMESLDTREAVTDLVVELLSEDEFRDGPSAGVVLQAYLRDAPHLADRLLDWTETSGRRHPLVIRLVKGAYWDHEVVEARQHGWESPVFEEKAESDRTFEALTASSSSAARRCGSRSRRTTCAASPTPSRSTAAWAAIRATSSSRSCAASATSSRRRWPRTACVCAPTAPSATSSQGWPTSSAGCSRTPRTTRSSTTSLRPPARRAAGGAVSDLGPFRNEPILELRRADRRSCSTGSSSSTRSCRSACRCGSGRTGATRTLPEHRPRRARARRRNRGEGDPEEAAEAVARAEAAFPAWARTPVEHRAEILVRAAQILRERRPADRAGGPRVREAVGRGRRRRLRGDRLPRVLRARRDRPPGHRAAAARAARRAQRADLPPARRAP